MSSRRKFEMMATIAEWTDDATGKRCKRTVSIGTVFEHPSGKLSARLELVPVFPGWSGFLAFREIDQHSEQTPPQP